MILLKQTNEPLAALRSIGILETVFSQSHLQKVMEGDIQNQAVRSRSKTGA